MKHRHRRNIIRTKETVRNITRLNEGPWRWNMGMQAGLAIGAAMAVFLATGHAAISPMASLGALAVLYGTKRPTQERLLVMLCVGAGLVLCSAAGVACASREWLSFICLILIAGLSNALTAGTGVGPPGPVMFVLVATISARLASPQASVSASSAYAIPIVIGIGALVAWAVVAILSALPLFKDRQDPVQIPPLQFAMHLTREDGVVISRVVFCVAAAILLSKPLGITRVHWVIVAVTAILQAGLDKRLSTQRAIQRVLGTILGVIIFEVVHVFELPTAGLVIAVVLLQFATQVVIARNYVLGLIFITPMALLLAASSQPNEVYITSRERIFDTLLGAGLAIAVFWIEEGVLLAWAQLRRQQKDVEGRPHSSATRADE
jgi:hypothetical protein